MSFTSLTERLRGWKTEVKRTLDAPDAKSAALQSPTWYAGLAVSPASFSHQLGEMQLSLLRDSSRPAGTTESVAGLSTRELIANDERMRAGARR